jgi:glycosyltransferase involved in cell wall biosynthesis
MRVLYDGWSLVHHPLGPESLHLLSVLENLPQEISPVLAVPQPVPDWQALARIEISPSAYTPWGQLRWEQILLPSLAKDVGADLLHLATPAAPAFAGQKTVFSPAGYGADVGNWAGLVVPGTDARHVISRLRRSLGMGGLEQVTRILWPDDLPSPELQKPISQLSPILPWDFSKVEKNPMDVSRNLKLPEGYVLYHGPGGRQRIDLVVQAWNWAAGAIGEYYPLLLVGLDDNDRQIITEMRARFDLGETIQVLPDVLPTNLPQIYWQSTAVFHPAPASPWCGPTRLAMAAGKPLVSIEHELTAAIVGPAAYLIRENDARALGAALVTVVVEEELAERLSAAALKVYRSWNSGNFSDQLRLFYLGAIQNG